ncbi:MAG: aspartate dehydrogenase [Candidatus Omnitrophota bacterium]
MKAKVLSVIGCGAIGTALVERVGEKMFGMISKVVIYDTDAERSRSLQIKMKKTAIAGSLHEAVEMADIVVEAASPEAAREVLRLAPPLKKDVMILSVGGIVGREKLLDEAAKAGITVILPSGAIAGVDALKAARIAGIDSVTLTTMKPPASLKGAPYIAEKGIDIDAIDRETVIFEGTVSDAVRAFPKNINVSAVLSLAGIGPERTKVRIISSPEYLRNIHEIRVESKAGTFTFRTENVPFPSNPKTSYLAALSAITALEEYFSPVRIGT